MPDLAASPPGPVLANPPLANPLRANPVLANPVRANPVLAAPLLANPVLATIMDTPIGPLSLLTQGGTLIAGGFTADSAVMHARLGPPLRTPNLDAEPLEIADPGDLPWLATPIASYFEGDLRALDTIPVYQPGTPSRQRLWAALRAVPPGRTVSYTQLAEKAGLPRAPRAAGAACAFNLIALAVPCHRALRMDGSLGGYYYGLGRKTWLLHHEGAQGG